MPPLAEKHTAPNAEPRQVWETKMKFFQDDATGEWGVTHDRTLDGKRGNDGFNAFWDGEGLFHDVFEHSQEHQHEWFRGDAAMNVGGEMWAMGALCYYSGMLGMNRFPTRGRSIYSPSQTAMHTTASLVQEAIESGRCDFGDRLVCDVPFQKATHYYSMESMLDDYEYELRKYRVGKHDSDNNAEFCRAYKRSATMAKVRRLHRGGHRWAEALVPRNEYNRAMAEEFIEFWNKLSKANPAEQMALRFRSMTFRIFHLDDAVYEGDTNVFWTCEFQEDPGYLYGMRAGLEENETLTLDEACPFFDSRNLPKVTPNLVAPY